MVGNAFVNPFRQWNLPRLWPFLAVFVGWIVENGVFAPPLIQHLRSSLALAFGVGFLEFALLALLQGVGDPAGGDGSDRRAHGGSVVFVDGLPGESATGAAKRPRYGGGAVECQALAGLCRLVVITAGGHQADDRCHCKSE